MSDRKAPLPIVSSPEGAVEHRAPAAPSAERRAPSAERRASSAERRAPRSTAPDLRDEDLHPLLVAFYDTVERDDLLAPYFAPVDMSAHMPRIVDFWSTLVFDTRRYTGNAFRPHLEMPGLTAAHFARWVATMETTIDERHAGERAERMKALAHRIAYSMQLRLGIEPFAEFRALP